MKENSRESLYYNKNSNLKDDLVKISTESSWSKNSSKGKAPKRYSKKSYLTS